MKSKTSAGIFALLLGGLGIHRFYLGQAGMGILYLIFCWTFIPSIIAFVEGILFLAMSDEEFNQKYNTGVQTGSQYTYNSSQRGNVAEELERLYNLKEKGIITEAEFQAKKATLL